jgi:hypothetical protein
MSVAARALPSIAPGHRDDDWLRREVDDIWARYFDDTPRVNEVEVGWRRPWKRRLGVISLSHDQKTTRIGLNSLLARHDAPYCLTLITVAHELTHYAHGFGSPLPRKYRHPHRGGIVTRELRKRGLEAALAEYHGWIEEHWWSFYARHGQRRRR